MKAARRFAATTRVSPEKTRADIDRLLVRAGATLVAIGTDHEKRIATVGFAIRGAGYRIQVPLPNLLDEPTRRRDQLERTAWRCTLLLIKAKLETVAMGLSTVEREFMADMLLPNGTTVENSLAEALRKGLFEDAPRALPEVT